MNPIILHSVIAALGLAMLYFAFAWLSRHTRRRWVEGTWAEGAVMAALGVVLCLIFYPVFMANRAKNDMVACDNNLKQIAQALLQYAQEHGDCLPPADRWMDVAGAGLAPALFRCPAQGRNARYSYAMNANLSARSLAGIPRPAETILLFESRQNVRNAAGTQKDLGGVYRRGEYRVFGMQWVRVEPEKVPWTAMPHDSSGNFAFADGYMRWRRYDRPPVTEAGTWEVSPSGSSQEKDDDV
jgi:prepilin-type processing-associated H-X9-DG protein